MSQEIYAVAGLPVLHSKSPYLFNGVSDDKFIYIRISTDNPSELSVIIKELDIKGLNITTPLKESFLPFLDFKSQEVEKLKAVNTVIQKNGKLYGYNTDLHGVVSAFLSSKIELKGKNAIVIGNGGAGRAAVLGLQNYGVNVSLTNKTGNKLDEYSDILGCEYFKIEDIKSKIGKADIIVNTAPNNSVKFIYSLLKDNQIVLNADYRNYRQIEMKGRLIKGEKWLIYQAEKSFELFFGKKTNMVNKIFLEKEKSIKKTISLIGFMGAGKSETGRRAAELLNYDFFDSDSIIELETGKAVSEIFKDKGEREFREFEKKVLKELINKNGKKILSLGGGVIINDNSRELLKKSSLNIWLWTSNSETEKRLARSKRPLVDNPADIERIFNDRKFFYAETSDILVPTMTDPISVAKKIKKELIWE